MKPQIDVIEALRRANPVPPATMDGPVLDSLDDILRSVPEQETGMSSTMTEREGHAPTKKGHIRKYIGLAAALAAVMAVAIPLALPVASNVEWVDVTAEQHDVIQHVVEAIIEGDRAGFVDAFDPDGTFHTHLDFVSRASCCDSYPVANGDYIDLWMDVNEVWDLEADLQACAGDGPRTVRCELVARWRSLQMEQPEEWIFAFDGAELRSFGMVLSRQQLAERTMPLTYEDLGEFEAWVSETHPDRASRWSETERTIDGRPFDSVYLRLNPAFADEVTASIEEFVESR